MVEINLEWFVDIIGWVGLSVGGIVVIIAFLWAIGKLLSLIFDSIVGKYRLTYEFLFFLQHKVEIKEYICKTVSKEDKDFLDTKK